MAKWNEAARKAQQRYRSRPEVKAHFREYVRSRRERVYALKSRPCTDCGNCFPYECMDFDHVRGSKRKEISSMLNCSIEVLEEELGKCDLVCANCHRIRSRARRNHG